MPRSKRLPAIQMKGAVFGYLGKRKATIASLAAAKELLAQSSYSSKIAAKTLDAFAEEWWNKRNAGPPTVKKTRGKRKRRKSSRRRSTAHAPTHSSSAPPEAFVPVLATVAAKKDEDAITLQDLHAVQSLQQHLGGAMTSEYLQPIVTALDTLRGVERALQVHQALEKLKSADKPRQVRTTKPKRRKKRKAVADSAQPTS